MVAFAIKNYGGEIPRTDSRNLPDNQAEQAWNCDLSSGCLDGLPIPEFIVDLSAHSPQRAYRIPDPTDTGQADIWLPLPSPYSSVVRSPLANDTQHRFYWTNPNDGAYWATYAMLQAGTAPYNLGMPYPSDVVAPSVTAAGGTLDGSVPLSERSYLWTYVDQYGEESAPSAPSAVIAGAPDGTWTISTLPTTAPSNPAGKNYPPVNQMNLYRTITGTTTGAAFYLVTSFFFPGSPPPGGSYIDTTSDTTIVNNNQLYSVDFANPLDGLDGLTALPGGMLVGWTGNTVHFCEPNRPHAWPAAYDQSLQYEVQGFGVWQQSLVVLTKGFPSTGSGNSPANFVFTDVRVPEPCISRGSIITDLMGVYYVSQNGLVMLNYFGMQNQVLSMVTKNIWLNEFKATSILACRHRAQYLAINGTGSGFLIDYSESRLGMMQLSTFLNVVSLWNDEYSGDAYVMAAGKVYRWDSPNTGALVYRWRSKQFYTPAPVSLGACQISIDPDILTATSAGTPPLDNGDTSLQLPAGVNAVVKVFAGPDGEHLILTRNLTEPREIFRLPSGFKSFDWQIEVTARVRVKSIELATTMRELKVSNVPQIPQPVATVGALYNTVLALKQAVEILSGYRGPVNARAATVLELNTTSLAHATSTVEVVNSNLTNGTLRADFFSLEAGTITVDNLLILDGSVTAIDVTGTAIINDAHIATLSVSGTATVDVLNATTVVATGSSLGAAVASSLNTGTLDVTGSATLAAATATSLNTGTLDVSGNTTLAAITALDLNTGTLTVTGASILNGASCSGSVVASSYDIGSNQVIGPRITGWGAATGGSRAALNAGTATLPQTAAALAQVIADLTTHGVIGP